MSNSKSFNTCKYYNFLVTTIQRNDMQVYRSTIQINFLNIKLDIPLTIMETLSLVYMTNYLQNFLKTLLNSFAKPFPINVLPVSLFPPILSSENTKAYKQLIPIRFLIGCQHLVHAVDMMFVASLFFNQFFFR